MGQSTTSDFHETWFTWMSIMNICILVDIVTAFAISLAKLALRVQEAVLGRDSVLLGIGMNFLEYDMALRLWHILKSTLLLLLDEVLQRASQRDRRKWFLSHLNTVSRVYNSITFVHIILGAPGLKSITLR